MVQSKVNHQRPTFVHAVEYQVEFLLRVFTVMLLPALSCLTPQNHQLPLFPPQGSKVGNLHNHRTGGVEVVWESTECHGRSQCVYSVLVALGICVCNWQGCEYTTVQQRSGLYRCSSLTRLLTFCFKNYGYYSNHYCKKVSIPTGCRLPSWEKCSCRLTIFNI